MLIILISILAVLILTAVLLLLFAPMTFEVFISDEKILVKVGGKHVRVNLYDKVEQPHQEVEKEPRDSITIPTIHNLKKRWAMLKALYYREKDAVKDLLIRLKPTIDIKDVAVAVEFGMGDAALTGMVNGYLWSGISTILVFIDQYIDINRVSNIALLPQFTEKCFSYKITLVFTTKLYRFISPFIDFWKLYHRNIEEINIIKGGASNGRT